MLIPLGNKVVFALYKSLIFFFSFNETDVVKSDILKTRYSNKKVK